VDEDGDRQCTRQEGTIQAQLTFPENQRQQFMELCAYRLLPRNVAA
jgi:hypothetical protein